MEWQITVVSSEPSVRIGEHAKEKEERPVGFEPTCEVALEQLCRLPHIRSATASRTPLSIRRPGTGAEGVQHAVLSGGESKVVALEADCSARRQPASLSRALGVVALHTMLMMRWV